MSAARVVAPPARGRRRNVESRPAGGTYRVAARMFHSGHCVRQWPVELQRTMAMWFSRVLIWFARSAVVVLMIASFLPLIRTGAWIVRLCDFPRIQLLVLLLFPLLATAGHSVVGRRYKREHLILMIAIVATAIWQLSHAAPFTPVWRKELAGTTEDKCLRLMVANIEFNNSEFESVMQVLQQHDPDVLLLVEIDDTWKAALAPLRTEYPHRVEVIRDEGLGLALWSKLPIPSQDVKYLVSERRPSIFATLSLPDGTDVRFAGIHPTPPGLDDETEGGRRDSRVRDAELVLVAKEVKADPDSAWIVAGDFNDVAWSHTTRLFKRLSGLRDPRVGRTLLNTYHADYPLLRYPIDQVFLTEGSTVKSLNRVRLPGSDHFAVAADVRVPTTGSHSPSSQTSRSESREIIEEGEQDAAQRDVEAPGDP